MVNQKNPVVVVRFGRGLEESWCGSWGVGYDSKSSTTWRWSMHLWKPNF
jgi:hypothetical protein